MKFARYVQNGFFLAKRETAIVDYTLDLQFADTYNNLRSAYNGEQYDLAICDLAFDKIQGSDLADINRRKYWELLKNQRRITQ